MVKPIVQESIEEIYQTLFPECLKIADLGCSLGPNTLLVVSEIIEILSTTSQKLNSPLPSLQAFLNDLPGNDFNTIFRSLRSFYRKLEIEKANTFGNCFISGVSGSFYMGGSSLAIPFTLFILLMLLCGSPRLTYNSLILSQFMVMGFQHFR